MNLFFISFLIVPILIFISYIMTSAIRNLLLCGYFILEALFRLLIPSSKKSLREDIILITGGSHGLGRNLAIKLAERKPKAIVLWDINEERLRETSKLIKEMGVNCTTYFCDVSGRYLLIIKSETNQK